MEIFIKIVICIGSAVLGYVWGFHKNEYINWKNGYENGEIDAIRRVRQLEDKKKQDNGL